MARTRRTTRKARPSRYASARLIGRMQRSRVSLTLNASLVAALLATGCTDQGTTPDGGRLAAARRSVSFDKRVLDTEFRAEGVAIADIDGDGTQDLVTGSRADLGPSFAPAI